MVIIIGVLSLTVLLNSNSNLTFIPVWPNLLKYGPNLTVVVVGLFLQELCRIMCPQCRIFVYTSHVYIIFYSIK